MQRYVFNLPDVGEGTAEAEIVAWHVKVGDSVEEDEFLVDVMTDKATVEITSPVTGTVTALHGELGATVPVGGPLVELDIEGEGTGEESTTAESDIEVESTAGEEPTKAESDTKVESTTGEEPTETVAERHAVAPKADATTLAEKVDRPLPKGGEATQRAESVESRPAITSTVGEKPLAAPAVRRRAHELGIALQFVPGTGPAGRITHADLDAYVAKGGRPAPLRSGYQPRSSIEEVPIIGLRRKIAEKMQESKRRIPHFSYVEEIDMTELEALRAHLNATKRAEQPKLTLLPFLMRGLLKVLPAYPQINALFDDEAGVVYRHSGIHIGIATQTANGLVVPVVRHVEALDLWQSAAEVARVSAAARENKATKDELSGSTITITSLGKLGGVSATPVINYPEVAIIGPNAIIERPVVREGEVVVRKMMNLSSSFDHRVVDGYDAAEFTQKLKACLEHPATLFMEETSFMEEKT